jgi:hypothetical protein
MTPAEVLSLADVVDLRENSSAAVVSVVEDEAATVVAEATDLVAATFLAAGFGEPFAVSLVAVTGAATAGVCAAAAVDADS